MQIVSVFDLTKHYGEKTLFNSVSFSLRSENRVGIVGINGSGKSTLLKMLVGKEPPDSGKIERNPKARIAFLPQNPQMDDNQSVLDYVFAGESPTMQLLRDYRQAVRAISFAPTDATAQQNLAAVSQRMDTEQGWAAEAAAKSMLTRLGVSAFDAPLGRLSGGQRRRVALARVLLDPADLLILDEPTNHLDPDTIIWLEDFLAESKNGLLMVTHDRYFLDRVANHIFEIEGGKIHPHRGNYTQYLENRAARESQRQKQALERRSFLQKELDWVKRTPMARGGKQKARIKRARALLETETPSTVTDMAISVAGRRTGKKIIELHNISKSFGENTVIRNLSYNIKKRDRLGIVGKNGSGKSTLLNLISGRLQPDSGEVVIGATIHLGYYDQESTALNENQRVFDNITDVAEIIHTADGRPITAAQMLERFRFPRPMQQAYISTLSGGERRRLYLLRTLMMAPNVLLLDEPTNDLDIETLSILEDYLDDYDGVLVVVSHDRYFLDRTVEYIFAFEGDGKIVQYPGNYSDYRQKKAEKATENTRKTPKIAPKKNIRSRTKTLSYREAQELAQLEARMVDLEAEKTALSEKINRAGGDYRKMQELSTALAAIESELNTAFERWAELEEKRADA